MTEALLARRAAALLRILAASAVPLGLSELARRAELPKATCIRILRALVDEHLVELDPDTKRYTVSFTLVALLAGRTDDADLVARLRRELRQLCERTQETAGIDLFVGGEVVVVLQEQGPRLISQSPKPVPRRLPPLRSSTGKAFLTWSTDGAAGAVLADLGPTERRQVDAQLARWRDLGYAVAFDELDPGAAAIAAPVHVDGELACTVWIGGPTFRISRDRIPELAGEVVTAAGRIAGLLGTDPSALAGLVDART